jgi:hypothetical protein
MLAGGNGPVDSGSAEWLWGLTEPHGLTKRAADLRIEEVLPKSGPVAQLGARFHGMEEVTGSIPVRSTNNPTTCKAPPSQPGVIWCEIFKTPSLTLRRA